MLMTKTMAFVHVSIIVIIVGYSTFHLFLGDFGRSLTALPLLMGYYVFFTARQKKKQLQDEDDVK